ncbi:hypothetical protein [Thalassoglobus sp.]|uniref:hypothetical protein n=1 Tax=Thalassoglobus sp. TaxID=2795869 RepID=UPI003AA9649C
MEQSQRNDGITSISLGPLKGKARIEAAYQGLSLSAFIRQLITIWLQYRDEIEQLSSADDTKKGGE